MRSTASWRATRPPSSWSSRVSSRTSPARWRRPRPVSWIRPGIAGACGSSSFLTSSMARRLRSGRSISHGHGADYWTKAGPDDLEGAWQHTSRAAAPGMALIGRVNEEPLALLRLAAAGGIRTTSKPCPRPCSTVSRLSVWMVSVPAEKASECLRAAGDLSRLQPALRPAGPTARGMGRRWRRSPASATSSSARR